jgi:N-succinyldiaminopimelate aminotransferase
MAWRAWLTHNVRECARTTIFGQMSALATELGAVNLGQGFPDVDGPQELKDIAVAAIVDGSGNQYPPAHGLLDLRSAISEHQQRHYGLTVSPDTGVVVTTGASEALAAAVLALVEAGDEVIVLEPYFDLYAAIIAMAGATELPFRWPFQSRERVTILDERASRRRSRAPG